MMLVLTRVVSLPWCEKLNRKQKIATSKTSITMVKSTLECGGKSLKQAKITKKGECQKPWKKEKDKENVLLNGKREKGKKAQHVATKGTLTRTVDVKLVPKRDKNDACFDTIDNQEGPIILGLPNSPTVKSISSCEDWEYLEEKPPLSPATI